MDQKTDIVILILNIKLFPGLTYLQESKVRVINQYYAYEIIGMHVNFISYIIIHHFFFILALFY